MSARTRVQGLTLRSSVLGLPDTNKTAPLHDGPIPRLAMAMGERFINYYFGDLKCAKGYVEWDAVSQNNPTRSPSKWF